MEQQVIVETPAENKPSGKKKGLMIGLICGGSTLLLAVVILLGIPFGRYFWADSLLKQGQYQEAWATFEDLGGFLESPEKLQECKYGQAVDWMNSGNLTQAKEIFVSLGDYQACPEQVTECDYLQALAWLNQGKFQEALAAFEALGSYKDSADQIIESKYQWALALMAQGDYQTALEKLEQIGDYQDSQEQVKECKYQLALALLAEGKVTEGYDALIALGDYKDSADQAKEVKSIYNRIKGKSKLFVNKDWQYYYKGSIDFYTGLTTKKVDSDTLKITIYVFGDYMLEKGDKSTESRWEFTCKWDPATGRLNYTNGKRYKITYTMVDPATDKTTKKKSTVYSDGTGYFYYENSKLYWESDNGENTKNSYFKRAK